ncbi:MAG: c-type cytochrome domain-containing protein [Pirellulaceae bacterium]
MPRLFVFALCWLVWSSAILFADEEAVKVDVMQQVQALDQEAAAISQEEQAAQAAWLEARKMATDLQREWKGLLTEMDRIEREKGELAQKIKDQKEAREKAAEKQKEAQEAIAAAKKQIEEANKKLAASEKEIEEAEKTTKEAAKSIDEAQTEITKLDELAKPLPEQAQAAQKVSDAREAEVAQLKQQADEFTASRIARQAKIETLLRDANRWISFSDQIAPVFHQRCVACHNPRNPKGRYNMANFASILAGGDSGEAIIPGDADNSLLYLMVEDGSMPYESDPLPEDQIELIRAWIALGARLDGAADSESPLIRLMPRVTQPDPPETYNAPVPVTAVAVDPEGQHLASSGYHEVLVFNAADGKLVRRITNVAQRVYGLAFHPDGKRLAVASGTPGQLGEVKLFDMTSGELVSDLLMTEDAMFDVAFSPDGKRLAACGAGGAIALFDLESENLTLVEDHSDWVHSIAWSSDGKQLVSASRDKTAKVFDAKSGSLQITFSGHGQSVTTARFLDGGKQVISGGDDRRLRIWNVKDGKQARDIGGFGGEISVIHTLENNRVLTAGAEHKIRIHNAQDGKRQREFQTPPDWISSLTLSADGKTLYYGNHQGEIHRQKLEADSPEQTWQAVPAK